MTKQEKAALKKGCLIVFEGIDGTGKSTQLQMLANHLTAKGLDVVTTREPTAGTYGRKIRALYHNREQVSREEELRLFIDDRREHVENLISPALQQKKVVLCDRYFLSTIAYQGAAGFVPERILEMNDFAPRPDLALLFDLAPQISIKRITEKRGELLNDFEKLESLNKVAALFNSMDFPYIRHIDGNQTLDKVHRDVIITVDNYLDQYVAD